MGPAPLFISAAAIALPIMPPAFALSRLLNPNVPTSVPPTAGIVLIAIAWLPVVITLARAGKDHLDLARARRRSS